MNTALDTVGNRCEFIAVRRGRNVNNCLFFSWHDAKPQLEAYESAEYRLFDSMIGARDYLILRNEMCSDHQPFEDQMLLQEYASPDSETPYFSTSTQNESVNIDIMSNVQQGDINDDEKEAEYDETKGPSPSWIRKLEEWKSYRDQTRSFYIVENDPKSESLRKWIYDQNYQYKLLKQGKKSNMTDVKINMMKQLGYDFDYEPWEFRFEQLKAFYERHGHLDLSSDSLTHNSGLEKWLKQQRTCLARFSKGKNTSLTIRQVNKLASFGINSANSKAILNQHSKTKALRIETAAALQNWNNMLKKLEQYKAQEGHLNVSFQENKSLAAWIVTQRTEYKKLKNGQSNRMTAVKMQKLTDLGFKFTIRPSYKTWDERMNQLRKFKNEHGHLRIQVSDNDLGEFVSRMRQEYNKFQEGRKSSLTNERIIALANMGFVWGNRIPTAKSENRKRMTWDERYDELVEYANVHGNCLVPQHTSLGEWGHKQRTEYKKLKNGEPTRITAIKIQKLTEIGFVFDASSHRKKRIVQEVNQVNHHKVSTSNTHSRTSNTDVQSIGDQGLDPRPTFG